MFAQSHNSYKVEESSMEEFLLAIQKQKSKSSDTLDRRYHHLERKFIEAHLKEKF